MNGDNRVNDDATARRCQLGRLLRRARTDAGLTQTAVAERLGCRQAKINKIETTLVSICPPDIARLIEIYGVDEQLATELQHLAALDQEKGPARTRYPANSAFTDLSELEPDAKEVHCWHSERLPGPLQSEPYMLKVHKDLITGRGAVTQYLRQWTARGRVFTVPNPPRYHGILSESSLRRIPGRYTTALLSEQIEYLIRLIDTHEHVDLRILPFDADVSYVDTDFEILRFADRNQPDFAYIEYPSGSKKFKGQKEIREFQAHWDMLEAAALSRAETRDFLFGYIPASAERVP